MTPWAALYPPTVSIRPATDPQHMLHAWDRTVAAYQDRPGVHYFDATFTFSELDRQADALAAAMRDRGLAPGDRVGIYLQNDPQWLVSMIATWKLGATAVALNPMLRTEELRHHLEDSQPKVLICDEAVSYEQMDNAIDDNAAQMIRAGFTSAVSNRKALRVAQEPLTIYRRYMATYARQQALCFYDPKLIDNLEHSWKPSSRRM